MLEKIQNEPYRLFFPLGIVLALGGVGHWLFYAAGWMSHAYGFLHANMQVMLYLPCFVGGFLMTAVPRFSATWTARRWELAGALALMTGITGALFNGRWLAAEALYVLWLLLLARFIVTRFLKRQVDYPPIEFVWIPPAVFLGLCGTLVIILALAGRAGPGWMQMGRSMQEQGFLLALVIGVGGFLGPKLMGVHQMSPVNAQNFKAEMRKKIATHAAGASLLIVSFFLEGRDGNVRGYILRAAVVTGMLVWSKSLNDKVIAGPSLFTRALSASFWMIASGYWLIPVFPKLQVALLHMVFLGGFSLMISCVSTMVVLSHSGRGELLHRPLWIFWLIAAGFTVSVSLRVGATFFAEHYFMLLGISSGAWLIVQVGWLIFALPFILSGPAGGVSPPDHRKIIESSGHAC